MSLVIQVVLTVIPIYLLIGLVLFLVPSPIQGQEYDNLADLKLYLLAWPVELYRMYKYTKDGDY
jgi:hypothetical protein